MGKWLKILIEQANDPDYNDADDVLGWLGVTLTDDVLIVEYESGDNNATTFEHYRVVPMEGRPT